MDCICDGAGRTQFRMQSALGLNWTPRDDLVWSTEQRHVCSTNTLAYEPGDADEWRACCDTRDSVIVPEDGCEVESRKAADLIVVARRRDDAGSRGRLHRWGRCPERWAQDGPRQRRSDGRGSGTCRRPLQPRRAARSAAGRRISRRHATKMQSLADAATGRTCRDPRTDRRVWLRRQVRRSGCSRSVQRCGLSIGPDCAAPAGPATPPTVALPTRAMPAPPPSEARCVRSNSIRARW